MFPIFMNNVPVCAQKIIIMFLDIDLFVSLVYYNTVTNYARSSRLCNFVLLLEIIQCSSRTWNLSDDIFPRNTDFQLSEV